MALYKTNNVLTNVLLEQEEITSSEAIIVHYWVHMDGDNQVLPTIV